MIRCLALVPLLAVVPAVRAQLAEPLVTITGGADNTRHNYNWQVTNNHTSPLVYIEFPHYRADMFIPPDGWSSKNTHLVNVGVEQKPGVCTATPTPPEPGLRRGQTAAFYMRIANGETRVGKGEVQVKFADGTSATIGNVELPTQPVESDKWVPLIAGLILLGGLVFVQARKRNRSGTRVDAPPAPEQPAE